MSNELIEKVKKDWALVKQGDLDAFLRLYNVHCPAFEKEQTQKIPNKQIDAIYLPYLLYKAGVTQEECTNIEYFKQLFVFIHEEYYRKTHDTELTYLLEVFCGNIHQVDFLVKNNDEHENKTYTELFEVIEKIPMKILDFDGEDKITKELENALNQSQIPQNFCYKKLFSVALYRRDKQLLLALQNNIQNYIALENSEWQNKSMPEFNRLRLEFAEQLLNRLNPDHNENKGKSISDILYGFYSTLGLSKKALYTFNIIQIYHRPRIQPIAYFYNNSAFMLGLMTHAGKIRGIGMLLIVIAIAALALTASGFITTPAIISGLLITSAVSAVSGGILMRIGVFGKNRLGKQQRDLTDKPMYFVSVSNKNISKESYSVINNSHSHQEESFSVINNPHSHDEFPDATESWTKQGWFSQFAAHRIKRKNTEEKTPENTNNDLSLYKGKPIDPL